MATAETTPPADRPRPATGSSPDGVDGMLAALAGRRYDLEQPRFHGQPAFPAHEPNFSLHLHRRHEPGLGEPRTSASAMLVMAEHSGTHLDALCHQAVDQTLHGDVPVDAGVQTSAGFTALGVDTIEPILCRGVLVDLAAARGVPRLPDRELVGAAEMQAAIDGAGVELRPGDAVLVRTGNDTAYGDRPRYEAGPGIDTDASRLLAAASPRLVGCDTVAWDLPGHRDEELDCTLPGHVVLLVGAGVLIVENLRLDELAADGVREFTFLCVPLKLRGGTGSPVRPVAIVPA